MVKNKNWQIRGSTIYLTAIALTIIGIIFPIIPGLIMPLVGLIIYIRLRMTGHIKSFDWLEIAFVLAYTVGMFIATIYLELATMSTVPWWQIILLGIACDVIATTLSTIPIFGDILSGILVFFAAMYVIPGLGGLMAGLAVGIISMFPGPTLGINTIILIGIKLISTALFGG